MVHVWPLARDPRHAMGVAGKKKKVKVKAFSVANLPWNLPEESEDDKEENLIFDET